MLLRSAHKKLQPMVALTLQVLSDHGDLLARFGLVGMSGVVVNYTLLYLLAEVGDLNHLLAASVATEAAILSNFTFNNLWTFRYTRPKTSWRRRALQYNLFCLGGLVISVCVLAMLTYLVNIHYLVANIFAIGAATLWNYGANRYWTWPIETLDEDTKAVIEGRVM
jgi:dolichol-phosphate mannosyltransferase